MGALIISLAARKMSIRDHLFPACQRQPGKCQRTTPCNTSTIYEGEGRTSKEARVYVGVASRQAVHLGKVEIGHFGHVPVPRRRKPPGDRRNGPRRDRRRRTWEWR